jgi:hypothetical protein
MFWKMFWKMFILNSLIEFENDYLDLSKIVLLFKLLFLFFKILNNIFFNVFHLFKIKFMRLQVLKIVLKLYNKIKINLNILINKI